LQKKRKATQLNATQRSMGILEGLARKQPATAVVPNSDGSAVEKAAATATHDSGSESPARVQAVVAPELEKRVVRKLDKHLTPLVSALCKFVLLLLAT
jgi:hypothetical protein